MRPHHLFLTAHRCKDGTLSDIKTIKAFVEYLAHVTRTQIVQGPHTSARETPFPGVTATAITHTSHLAIHTFMTDRVALLHILSYEPLESEAVKEAFINHFGHDLRHIRIKEMIGISDALECEEVGCVRPAVREWQGRLVCSDHYDRYRQEYEEVHSDDSTTS